MWAAWLRAKSALQSEGRVPNRDAHQRGRTGHRRSSIALHYVCTTNQSRCAVNKACAPARQKAAQSNRQPETRIGEVNVGSIGASLHHTELCTTHQAHKTRNGLRAPAHLRGRSGRRRGGGRHRGSPGRPTPPRSAAPCRRSPAGPSKRLCGACRAMSDVMCARRERGGGMCAQAACCVWCAQATAC